jgi:hypothetical protein
VNFGCGGSSTICSLIYKVDGVDVTGFVPVSQTGAAPQTQAAQNIVAPSTGTTFQVDVEGWSVGGQLNDTVSVTYNLVDPTPVATCSPATNVTQSGATFNGTLADIPVGGSAQWKYGTSPGVYTSLTSISPAYANGPIIGSPSGLSAGTTYYYRLEILNAAGSIVATSGECNLTTLTAIIPPTPKETQMVKLCSITGVSVLRDCTTNNPILLVHVASADGDVIPVDSTEFPAPATGAGVFSTISYFRSYYANTSGVYLNPQPTQICLPSSAGRIEIVCRCDDTDGDGVGEISYKEIVKIDDAGVTTILATYNRTMTTAYTPVSPVDCSVPGDNLVATTPRYKVLSGVGTWVLNADSVSPTTSVTFTVITVGNVANPPSVTDSAGTNSLFAGQSVTWSVIHQRDVAGLKSPLSLSTKAGDVVSVAWTSEVV